MRDVYKPLDRLLSQTVILRDGFRCRRCERGPQSRIDKSRGVVLQAAHIYGKGAHPAMRYDLRNVICLCKGCHFRWWHKTGHEAAPTNEVREWCEQNLGIEHMEMLDLIAQSTKGKGKPLDFSATWLMLETEIRRLTRTPASEGFSESPG